MSYTKTTDSVELNLEGSYAALNQIDNVMVFDCSDTTLDYFKRVSILIALLLT